MLRRAFDAKFWGHVTMVQAALPYLAPAGSITLLGAISACAARQAYFAQAAAVLPVRRVATADDIADAVVLAATNPNLTGTVIETDGGARLVSMS